MASQAADPKSQQRVWLVTLILATLSAFLCLLVFLALMRIYRKGKLPKLSSDPTPTDSVWAAAGGRVAIDDERMPDGELKLPAVEDVDAADEPFWDAEEEGDEPWNEGDDDDDGEGGDEPWR